MEEEKQKNKVFNDLGFGTLHNQSGGRFINKDGNFNIKLEGRRVHDIYKVLINMSWWKFNIFILLSFIGINFIIALSYIMVGVDQIAEIENDNFLSNLLECFFLSVQTFTSLGYGRVNPIGWGANAIASFNAFIGLISFALATGLVYARFSKPAAHILFSKNAIVVPYKHQTDLMSFQFRIVNGYAQNHLLDLEVQVIMTCLLKNKQGTATRIFERLKLERDDIKMLPLNWTIVHVINESSPLFRKNKEDFKEMNVEFLVLIKAYDDVYSQQVNKKSSYIANEILWNRRFVPMYQTKDNSTVLNLEALDQTEIV